MKNLQQHKLGVMMVNMSHLPDTYVNTGLRVTYLGSSVDISTAHANYIAICYVTHTGNQF